MWFVEKMFPVILQLGKLDYPVIEKFISTKATTSVLSSVNARSLPPKALLTNTNDIKIFFLFLVKFKCHDNILLTFKPGCLEEI